MKASEPIPSSSHLILIPSYNTGGKVLQTVWEASRIWQPVWVVVDGSTDGTLDALQALARDNPAIRVLALPYNQGKGAAILNGLRHADAAGFTHVLTMDADGQHPPEKIQEFIAASRANPDAQILGVPIFDATAPLERVHARKIVNWWANFETLWVGIGDSLFGFRVYPVRPLLEIMEAQPWMRRYDFDSEAVVRLCWRGHPPINKAVPVKYFRPEEGGVSHFRYFRDNVSLFFMHVRLLLESLVRMPFLLGRRLGRRSALAARDE
jgi:glycosyltransferase involved in cell wall biosynthesis